MTKKLHLQSDCDQHAAALANAEQVVQQAINQYNKKPRQLPQDALPHLHTPHTIQSPRHAKPAHGNTTQSSTPNLLKPPLGK